MLTAEETRPAFYREDFEPYCVEFLQELGFIPVNGMVFSLTKAQEMLTGKTYTYAGETHVGGLVRMSGRVINLAFEWDGSPDTLPVFTMYVAGDPIVRFIKNDRFMSLTALELHEGSHRFHSRGSVSLPLF